MRPIALAVAMCFAAAWAQSPQVQPGRRAPASSRAQQKFETGLSYVQRGQNSDAIKAFREALRLNPDLTEAHFSLGVLLARQGIQNDQEAMQQFLEVLRLNPRDVDARVNISNLLDREGDLDAAIAAMRAAIALASDKNGLYILLGQKQNKAGQYVEAARSFREALRSAGSSPAAHFGLGVALKHLRDLDTAAMEFEAVLRRMPDDPDTHFELGVVLAQQKRLLESAAELEEAARLRPGMAEIYSELGKVYRDLDRPQDSEAAFRKALALKPDQTTALYSLARGAKGEENSRQLFARIRELQTRAAESGEPDNLNAEGVRLMASNQLDEALAAFRGALNANPKLATAAYNIGVVLARQGRMQESAESFRAAIRLRPGFGAAHFGLALVLQASGDPNAAEEFRAARTLNELTDRPAAQPR